MNIERYTSGQALTPERLNALVNAALSNIVGGDGIQVSRQGQALRIGLSRRDRGVPPAAMGTGGGSTGGGGLTVDQEVLSSPGSTTGNPIIDNIALGADGNYLVWVQVKVSGGTGTCEALLQFTEDMTTYTVCELHAYCSDSTGGQTLSGICWLSSWDNDRLLFLTVNASASLTVEATETFVLWAKY